MTSSLLRTSILLVFAACATLAAPAIYAQTITTITIKNGSMVTLRYKSGSTGGGQESPQPARILAPGASTSYRLSLYTEEKNAGSVTYEGDTGGFGCRFTYATTRLDGTRWQFDNNALPSGRGRSICEMKTLSMDPRSGSQALEFKVR